MKYTVVWLPSAEDRLTRLWLDAKDRQAVTESADRIDRELRNDAHRKGTPLGHFRAFYDVSISVLYTVDVDERMVRVIQVRGDPS
jgi:mRNA-degrading endonuclease RelE of RelBE toxin-antitoxin system